MNRREMIRAAFHAVLVGATLPLLGIESEKDRRIRLIREFLSTTEGRDRLAEAMISPIRRRLDYQASLRDFLGPQEIVRMSR